MHIFITYYTLHVSMSVTPSSGRPLRYLLKNCMLFAVLLHMLCAYCCCTILQLNFEDFIFGVPVVVI
jgi:hypothetical protein